MKWYSRSKEDYREILIQKYILNPSLYRNQKSMKEVVLVTTKDCSKCKFISPSLEKWCEKNWYSFKEMEYWEWMPEVTSVPCAIIWEDVILDFEWIIELITDKNSFYK